MNRTMKISSLMLVGLMGTATVAEAGPRDRAERRMERREDDRDDRREARRERRRAERRQERRAERRQERRAERRRERRAQRRRERRREVRREARRDRAREKAIYRAQRRRAEAAAQAWRERRIRRRRRPVVVQRPGVAVRIGRPARLGTPRWVFVQDRARDLAFTLRTVDRNLDGVITRGELRRASRRGIVLPPAVRRQVLRNRRASVAFLEANHRHRLRRRFARLDLNGDGYLSRWELRNV